MMYSPLCVIIMFNYEALQIFFFFNVKKARNRCTNDRRETKEIEVVVRVCSYILKRKRKKKSITSNEIISN